MVNLFLLIFFVVVNLSLARYDAWKIKRHLRIRHAVNAIVYCSLFLIFWKWLTISKVLGLLLIRIPVFNTALNYFRNHSLTHLSKTTTSIIDRIMNRYIERIGYWTYNLVIIFISMILIFV